MTTLHATHVLRQHRWPAVRAASRAAPIEIDDAGRALSFFARSLLNGSSKVLRAIKTASQTAVRKHNYEDQEGIEDRAWRLASESLDAFCILDESEERALLNLIVGGAPSGRLSEIERRIVGEAVSQLLLAAAPAAQVSEELRVRPAPPTWSCIVELWGAGQEVAKLSLFTTCRLLPRPRIVRPSLEDVCIHLRAALSPHTCELGRVSRWECGSVVRLHRGQKVQDVFLYAGSQQLARGQLGSFYGERAILIAEVLGQSR
jgi:Type III flagellar switch regulator (C-ring) FliN C-term